MKTRAINVFLSVLFAISLLVTVFCLTVLNKNFVIRCMDKSNYYRQVYGNIKKDFDQREISYELTEKKVENDIKSYVRSRYRNNYYQFSNQESRDDYNNYIKLNGYFQNLDMCMIIYLIYIVEFILIFVTGMLFLKTKGIHDLSVILTSNFVLTIVVFGIISLFWEARSLIVYEVISSFSHYYLAVSIILFEMVILNKFKTRLFG